MVYIGKNEYKYGRMIMSHMIADSLEELHEMADKLKLKRSWFQDKPNRPHYDICKSYKQKALNLGAIEISDKEIIKLLKY